MYLHIKKFNARPIEDTLTSYLHMYEYMPGVFVRGKRSKTRLCPFVQEEVSRTLSNESNDILHISTLIEYIRMLYLQINKNIFNNKGKNEETHVTTQTLPNSSQG